MDRYFIHHCTGVNAFTEKEDQPRKLVGFVLAQSVEAAYRASQNDEYNWHPRDPQRSTSVGDVIQGPDGFFMVCGMGVKEIHLKSPDYEPAY